MWIRKSGLIVAVHYDPHEHLHEKHINKTIHLKIIIYTLVTIVLLIDALRVQVDTV